MHFRGEGKTDRRLDTVRCPFYPMHFRGEGKTLTDVGIIFCEILPDALPGGRQNGVESFLFT